MRVLLDTHILLWVISTPERVDPGAIQTVLDTKTAVLFSAASIWEIAIKAGLRRADFVVAPETVLQEALDLGFTELPLRSTVASKIATMPLLHRDPFDRLLVAQAMAEPAVLFTADPHLLPYSELVKHVGARRG